MAADGGLFAFGKAGSFGSPAGQPLDAPVVAMAAHPGEGGYWLLTADGTVLPYGIAAHYGDLARQRPSPLVGLDTAPDGNGYRLLVSDGDLAGFGSATIAGPAPEPAQPENRYTGIHSHPTRPRSYWLTTDHGPVFGVDAHLA